MNNVAEKIENRAYTLFVNRNGKPGSQLEDWLTAEKQIEQESISSRQGNGKIQNKSLFTGTRKQ